MVSRKKRQIKKSDREMALKLYEKERRKNLLAAAGEHDFVLVLDGLKPSFNIGKIFRSGDAFGVREVHLININYFEVKAAKGSFRHVPAVYHENFATCHAMLSSQGYDFFALMPDAAASLQQTVFPVKAAFILGNEETGISFDPKDFAGVHNLKIQQFGQVESLNVSIAASIVMYEYARQHCYHQEILF